MNLTDSALDAAVPDAREAMLLLALRRQVAFVRAGVPFWRARLAGAGVNENSIESLADLRRIPILTKDELRSVRPAALLPEGRSLDVAICRWTSGTSGRPTVSFWSDTDWAALAASTARMLGRQAPMPSPIAFNGYSQFHLTGPLYHAALRRLGGTVYDRSHHPEDLFPTLRQMELFDFDTLVLPGRAVRGKGIGLGDLMELDPDLLARHGVRWWIGSSGTFDAESLAWARAQGVESISNGYGASEFGLFSMSCARNPAHYHAGQGHVLVEVVDSSGALVQNGQPGRIVVTHLCGMTDDGQACVHGGTQLLRLAVGDGATLLTDPCECGLTAPRLCNVHRV